MGVLSDKQLKALGQRGWITPYEPNGISEVPHYALGELIGTRKVISYGVGSYGYDARLANEFKMFIPVPGLVLDPKDPDPRMMLDFKADQDMTIVLPPHSYILGRTMETFEIPRDVIVMCIGKSTYARVGIIVNVTPLEPGWIGEVTLEISNPTPVPVRIYAEEGICQFVFHRGETACEFHYANKSNGKPSKYQNQKGIVVSK